VVGGGVVGVCSAYYLASRGASVTLLEKGEICSGSSYGNAGWIFPSHSMPLPAPGVVGQSIRWLVDRESPLYVRPRPSPALARWLFEFVRASTEEKMRRTFALNRELSLVSRDLYEKLAATPGLDFGYRQRGILMVCRHAAALRELEREVRLLEELGGEARMLEGSELRELEPAVAPDVAGGGHLPADAHIDPAEFVLGLAREAARLGVDVRTNTEVMQIERPGRGESRVIATRGEFRCDELVLAAGAWSAELARPLGLRIPIQPAKGYSVTVQRSDRVREVPLMLSEARIGVTPLGDRLRFAGTLELAGLDLSINRRRVEAILRAVRSYLPGARGLERVETWRGLRPCTPDDLPVIGRPRAVPGFVVATGHGMTGIAQGPVTGKLVAQLVSGEPPELDVSPFTPDRF
jgi:D-amino-acid dehydrogenase